MHITVLFTVLFLLSPAAFTQDIILAPGAALTKIADGFRYTEGPAWGPDGKLYFTDRGRIMAWSPEEGATVYRTDPGSPNGLVFTRSGDLIACETAARRVVSISRDGTETVLADSYGGKKLNAPNDVWIDSRGGIYFSDHSMRSKKELLEQDRDYIYYITPDRTKLLQLTDDLQYPNGVITNPDGDRLYVTDSGANKTFVYTVDSDGTLKDKKVFADEGYDGVSMDEKGNLYITPLASHISIYNPEGQRIGEIPTPARPSNVCFGGKDHRILFITAGNTVYSIRMQNRGLLP
jgi:gluconolactonase